MSIRESMQPKRNRVREWMDTNPNQPASMYVAAFASVLELDPNESPTSEELEVFIADTYHTFGHG